jgi:hypothetical protein
MKSPKRCLPVLAIGLVFFFTGTLAAEMTAPFDSTLNVPTLPCVNNRPLVVTGPTTVNIQDNPVGDATHVTVHLQIKANGQDDAGNPYQVNLEGDAQFDAAAPTYDVPFHSQWVGQGQATNFSLTGVITVYIHDDGKVTTVGKSVDLPTCAN